MVGCGVSATQRNIFGATPLWFAASRGHSQCVGFLIGKGANPDEATDRGTTPVYMALREKYFQTAHILLAEKRVDVHQVDTTGANLVFAAVFIGDSKSLSILHERGADFNLIAKNGRTTPLTLALNIYANDITDAKNYKENFILPLIKNYGANPALEVPALYQKTALGFIAERHPDLAEQMIAARKEYLANQKPETSPEQPQEYAEQLVKGEREL